MFRRSTLVSQIMRTRVPAALAGALVLASTSGWAAPPKIDVSNDSITCNAVVATMTLKPPISGGGTATSEAVKVKGSLNGCFVSGPNSAIVLSGTFAGTLSTTTNDCNAFLLSPLTGTLTFKWKADPTTPLLHASSTLTITTSSFAVFSGEPWGAEYAEFSLGSSSVTGAFTGGDAGATSSNSLITSQDANAFGIGCGSPAGLKKLNIGLGTFTFS